MAGKENDMQEVKSPKKPFLYYCLIVATIMVLLNSLVFPNVLKHSVKEVDYNTFMKMTENKEIGKVNIDSGEIIFTDKSEEKMYKTGVMDDPGLVDRLYDSGADFSSKITEEMSPILLLFTELHSADRDFYHAWQMVIQEDDVEDERRSKSDEFYDVRRWKEQRKNLRQIQQRD